jgi:hypothetical protein
MNSYQSTPKLDLPKSLFEEITSSIEQNKIIKGWCHETRDTGSGWFGRLLFKYCFKQGWFYVHRFDADLEKKIINHYQPFVDLIGTTPKIRLKITHDVRRLPPHSDYATGGDRSSIVTLIKGNNETTNWYNSGKDFKATLWNWIQLKKIDFTKFVQGKSYFFNNERVHNVTDCVPGATRYLLVISWQNVPYDDLTRAYKTYDFSN